MTAPLPDGLAALAGGEWDVAVDTWDGAPRAAGDAARALVDAVGHYVYVSSGSVYTDPAAAGLHEDSPVVDADPGSVDGDYPQLKAGAERAVREVFGRRALVARAGLILGRARTSAGCPGGYGASSGAATCSRPRRSTCRCSTSTSATWRRGCSTRAPGGWAARSTRSVLPAQTTMGELLDACVAATGADARLRWTDPASILAAGVQPWSDLPIWLPRGHPYRGLLEQDVTRALAAGLTCRPVTETVEDTWRWLREVGARSARAGRPQRSSIGLDPTVEAAVLAA